MRHEGVIGRFAGIALRPVCGQRVEVFETVWIWLRIGAGVPIGSVDVADGGDGFEGDFG
jgi:hypothetical protein